MKKRSVLRKKGRTVLRLAKHRRCHCGIYIEKVAETCPNCGKADRDPYRATTVSGFFDRFGWLPSSSGQLLVGAAVVALGLPFILLAPSDATPAVVLGTLSAAIIAMTIAEPVMLAKFQRREIEAKRRKRHENSTVARNTWSSKLGRQKARLKVAQTNLDSVVKQQAKVKADASLAEDVRDQLLTGLEKAQQVAEKVVQRSRKDAATIPFQRWQTQWIPLIDHLKHLDDEASCLQVEKRIQKLREEAESLYPQPCLTKALDDLDRIEAQMSIRLEGIAKRRLIQDTHKILKKIAPIDLDQEPIVEPSSAMDGLRLEDFSWFHDQPTVAYLDEVARENLDEEMRRLSAEMDIEDEFPVDQDDRDRR